MEECRCKRENKVCLRVIGEVKNNIKKRSQVKDWKYVISCLRILPELAEGLDNLTEYSHLVVIFWMHKVPFRARQLTKVHPQGKKEIPKKGVFATRFQHRPNPIGVSIVKILGRCANDLVVKGLDAFDGTPILDLKPYTGHPQDLVLEFKIPEWERRKSGEKGEFGN
jgi:tRNA-Thr(GGU) m(6)t(6)A37 methyltransferase TsaA